MSSGSLTAAPVCEAGKPGAALPLDTACLRALAVASPLIETEVLPLGSAVGRILAAPAAAPIPLPPFDNAAMDGYALRRADLSGAGPWWLPVSARICAGDAAVPLTTGTAARILTGAPVPEGADCVVMHEHVTRQGNRICVTHPPSAHANIRRAGEDVAEGAELLPGRIALTPPRVGLLAAAGLTRVSVTRRVRIAMISTGNELVEPGNGLGPGMIYNSNRAMLSALLSQPFVDLRDFGMVRDSPGLIRAAIRDAAASVDVIITTGGVSAGDADHILDALHREDATLDVLKVAMRPGKPVTVGRLGSVLFVGLPGNPYAALVTAMQIALPAIRRIAGLDQVRPRRFVGIAGFVHQKRSGSTEFVPVKVDGEDAYGRSSLFRLAPGASARLAPVSSADGIAILSPEVTRIRVGDRLSWEPFGASSFA